MKKRFFFIAAVALLFTACAKEQAEVMEPSHNAVGKKITVGVSFEVPTSGTKSDIDDDGTFYWSAEDAILMGSNLTNDEDNWGKLDIVTTSENVQFGPGKYLAEFEGTIFGDYTAVAAVFPHTVTPSYDKGSNAMSLTLPKTIAWSDSGLSEVSSTTMQADNVMLAVYEDLNPSWGYAQGTTDDLHFYNVGGLFRLTLNNIPVGATKLVFTTDKKINGTFDVADLNPGNQNTYPSISTSETDNEEEKSTTIEFTTTTEKCKKVFFIPVPVGLYQIGFAVKDASDNVLWSFSTNKYNTVLRGHMVKMPALTYTKINGGGDGATNIIVTPTSYSGTVYLPSTNSSIYVKMNETDGTINLEYSQSENALKPENVYLQALGDITSLNINLPESHVELTGEENVHTLTNVSANTSISTFVVDSNVVIGKDNEENTGLTITGGSLDLQAPTQKVTINIPETAANTTENKVQINITSTIKALAVERAAYTDKAADKIYVKLAPPVSETPTAITVEGINVVEKNCNLWVANGVTVTSVQTQAAENTVAGEVSHLAATGEGTIVNVTSDATVSQSISADSGATVIVDSDATVEGTTNDHNGSGTIATVDSESVAIIGTDNYTTLAEAVSAASDGATITIIKEGQYTIPAIAKSLTIVGGVEGVEVNHAGQSAVTTITSGKTLTLKNLALNLDKSYYQGFGTSGTGANAGALVMENCSIDGSLSLFGVSTFTNCTFTAKNANAGYYNIWAVYSNATFTGCSFTNTNRAVNVYDPACGQTRKTVTFTNCSFTATEKKKAAINIHHNPTPVQASGAKFDVVITDCTTSGTWASSVEDTGEPADATVCNSALWMVSDIENWTNGDITVNGVNVYDAPVAQIGTNTYATLEAAFAAANAMETEATITLLSDVTITENNIVVGGTHGATASVTATVSPVNITFDLNNHNITGTKTIYLVGGSLNITGTGTIETTNKNVAAVGVLYVKSTGGLDYTSKRTLTIGQNVTLKGAKYGLNVFGTNEGTVANNIEVNVNGTIKGDLFVLGNLSNQSNTIDINVNGTIDASAVDMNGIALNGFANVTVGANAVVKGNTGVEVRAGRLVVNGGEITATSDFSIASNGSGTSTKGAAVAVSQHTTNLPCSAIISGGTFTGAYALYEKDVETAPSDNITLSVTDGTFNGNIYSEDFTHFISGGSFSSDPTAYVAAGYAATQTGDVWTVTKSTDWADNTATDAEFAAATDGNTINISTPELLAKLAANVAAGDDFSGKVINLMSDIDLKGYEWEPIGTNGHNFAGEFNGNNHIISNLKVTRGFDNIDLNWRIGFIGSAINAKVHDFEIHNANVIGRGELAAAVGYNAYGDNSTAYIDNVKVTGHVTISAAHRGAAAVCGYSNRPVTNCTVNVDATSVINGFWASAGIVGFSPQSGDIKNNYSNIKVISDYACGGIVGYIENSVEISGNTVENTSLKGSTDYGTGGIIGMMNYGTGLLVQNNRVNNVVIESTENVAGILGAVWADDGTGNVHIKDNTLTGVTIKSKVASSTVGTALFIGYIEANKTATIEGNSFQGTIQSDVELVNNALWSGATAAENVTVSNNTIDFNQIAE